MPNVCNNWVRVSDCKKTIQQLALQPLRLDMIDTPPATLEGTPYFQWVDKYWGTKWINGDPVDECEVMWVKQDDGSLVAKFISAWAPPVAFYNRIVETYPQLYLEYEYAEWEMGFTGYGVGGIEKTPHHFEYQSKEEMESLKTSRNWHVTIWNPHFSSSDED